MGLKSKKIEIKIFKKSIICEMFIYLFGESLESRCQRKKVSDHNVSFFPVSDISLNGKKDCGKKHGKGVIDRKQQGVKKFYSPLTQLMP